MDRREQILAGLNLKAAIGLEIGALDKPLVRREDGQIVYVDYATKQFLADKYRSDPHVNVDAIVDVDAIWGEKTLYSALGGGTVDYVVASHVIEHVPDLISWLSELRAVLKPGGSVRLAIPDRRFTFDYLRNETRLHDVLAALLVGARRPLPQQMLDFYLGAAHVDIRKAWDGTLDANNLVMMGGAQVGMRRVRDSLENGTYYDVHCWVFTPKSFAELMSELASNDLIDFACDQFFDTANNTFEFFVSLIPSADRKFIQDSWASMAQRVHDDAPTSPSYQVRAASQQRDASEARCEELQMELDRAKGQCASLGMERDELKARRATLATELEAALRQSAVAQKRIAALESSTSWRVTRPLRFLSAALRGRASR